MRIRELLKRVTGSRAKSTTYCTLGKVGDATYVAELQGKRVVSLLIMTTPPEMFAASYVPDVTRKYSDISMMMWMRYSAPLTTSFPLLSGV